MAKAENEADAKSGAKPADDTSKQGDAAIGDKASTATAGAARSVTSAGENGDQTGAIAQLKADHRKVEALFAEFENAAEARKRQIIQQVCAELTMHTILEEEIFYPACREAGVEDDDLNEAQVEHDSAKLLIGDLRQARARDPYRDAKFMVLSEQVKHHVAEEEKPGEGIFAKAEKAKLDTAELAQRLVARKQELQARSDRLSPSRVVSIQAQAVAANRNQQEEDMARQGPDRDERGRFTSDDDDRGYGRGGGRSYAAQNRERDERGRFTDDDDDRGGRGGYRSRGGRDDDDGRGWYGDSEGHSEASRRGWAERRGESRSFGRYDDDDDDRSYRSQGRDRDERGRFVSDDDDDRRYGGGRGGYSSQGRDRDERGRFTSDDDDRGYGRGGGGGGGGRSYAAQDRDRDDRGRFVSDDDDRGGRGGYRSRSRDDDDDRGGRGRGQGGWYGDSRGHAEAARRGWEERDGGGRNTRSRDDDDDDRRGGSRARGRDDDDDRGGRGQGGWFGDSRGHAQAARRGWENRR